MKYYFKKQLKNNSDEKIQGVHRTNEDNINLMCKVTHVKRDISAKFVRIINVVLEGYKLIFEKQLTLCL